MQFLHRGHVHKPFFLVNAKETNKKEKPITLKKLLKLPKVLQCAHIILYHFFFALKNFLLSTERLFTAFRNPNSLQFCPNLKLLKLKKHRKWVKSFIHYSEKTNTYT